MNGIRTEMTDRAAIIWIDRPEKRNALDLAMSNGIRGALEGFADAGRPLIIRSSTPGMFVSGADINELAQRTRREALQRVNHKLFCAVEEYLWPSVAIVDGYALGGGCELALACDFRISTPTAQWGLPEVTLGILPSAGGLTRLPRTVGWAAAKRMILTGQRITGKQAGQIGLADLVSTDLDAAASELLAELHHADMTAARYAKEAMHAPADARRTADAALQALLFESEETHKRLSRATRR